MNCLKINEPFRLVVENFCSQQIIFTKVAFYCRLVKICPCWQRNLKKFHIRKLRKVVQNCNKMI